MASSLPCHHSNVVFLRPVPLILAPTPASFKLFLLDFFIFFQKYLTSTPYHIFNLVVFYYTFIYLVYGSLWANSKHQEGRSPWWFY